MLQTQAIKPDALSVLERVMNIKEFDIFSLVGGTALALKYGHRMPVDLDFFSYEIYDTIILINALQKEFGNKLELQSKNPKWGIFCFMDGIKTDIVRYPHSTIKNPETN